MEKKSNRTPVLDKTKMKIFQTTQKHFSAMGFVPNLQQSNIWQFHAVNILICCIDAVLLGIHILREANAIEDYIESTFTLSILVGLTVVYMSIILENNKIFIFIELCAKELNDSE